MGKKPRTKAIAMKRAAIGIQNLQKTPNWLKSKKRLSKEQMHFLTLIKHDRFATAIKDMIILIATKAESAEDYHKLLNQIMKLPFIQKVWDDIHKDRQVAIIPIVIELLRDEGQDHLISKLNERLKKHGWKATEATTNKEDTNM